jgi:hypothetical protein
VVVDASILEPVSAAAFPANRENNSEVCQPEFSHETFKPHCAVILRSFRKFPVDANREYSSGNREFLGVDQGITIIASSLIVVL